MGARDRRFTERRALVVGGLRARREQLYAAQDGFFRITNYDTVHADLDLIGKWSPDLVILDEAQRIKNWNTRIARSVKRIASPYAIVLTGTPLENRLEELVSLVEFVDKHRLGPTFRFLAAHQMRDENGKVVGYRDLDRIGKTLAPVLIRRTKNQVLKQLPERLEKNFFVSMTPEQRTHHDENREVVARIVAKWRRYKFLSEADQRRLMIALQNMRMSCDSTYLLDHQTDRGVKADELTTLLDELLERPGSKVVVFSQWVRMLELLVRRLKGKRVDHVLFHGGVDGIHRKALTVVNMDLPWNPAVLEQRVGRVHRLGQRKPVRVINFIAEGTIEEGMLSVLMFKKSLFAGVLDGGEREVFLGGSRLSRFMETVEHATTIAQQPTIGGDRVRASKSHVETERRVGTKSPAAVASDWAALMQSGLAWFEQFAAVAQAARNGRADGLRVIHRDPQTGQDYLKVPVPSPEVLDRALQTIGSLLNRFRQ